MKHSACLAAWSYTALFAIDGATMAIYGLIVLARVPETRPARPAGNGAPSIGLAQLVRDRAFMRFLSSTFLMALLMFQSSATLSAWMTAQGHAPATFGVVLAVNGVLIVLFQPAVTEWLASRDPGRILMVSALLAGGGFALHGASALVIVHMTAVAIWTFGEIANAPTSAAVVAALAHPEARGRCQGMFTMSWGLASFVGPLVGPGILEKAGPGILWGGCLVIGVIAAAGFAATAPRRQMEVRSGR